MNRLILKILNGTGLVVVMMTLALAIRLVWEQTILIWAQGPQMVGFSLVHSETGGFLILAVLGGLVWGAAVAVFAALSRSLGSVFTRCVVVLYVLAWALMAMPYGFWQRLFVAKL